MSLRKMLSDTLVSIKKEKGLHYEDFMSSSGCSKSTVRYALNGGEKVSMESFEKLYLAAGVRIINVEVDFDSWDFE